MKNNSNFVAKYFKSFNKEKEFQPCIGTVIEAPPQLTISILSGKVILYPRMLYMNDRLFNDYTRQYKLVGEITEYSFDNKTNSSAVSNHPEHPIPKLAGSGTYKAQGTFINTDTLVEGDLVKVTPTEGGQMWIVDYKIRKI